MSDALKYKPDSCVNRISQNSLRINMHIFKLTRAA